MLKIKNANKYFNHKQLHVINNTSLELEDKGLVALLGHSGCGKTTLLNCIGGLDKLNKGKIYINDTLINSKIAYKTDKLRNLNIGYIFQDYKLIEYMSVYDNVALALKIVGIKDKTEINKRVLYVLDKVGMLRYKNRPAGMLSGGEKQRVSIARAIVKNPNIILADEPTGNLDSKNSLEVMKIIKSISKDKLVILVTHEQDLAKFYASRIIEIKDGKIDDDYINEQADELDYELENNFYLKDMDYYKIHAGDNNINFYCDDEKSKETIDIVIKKGNIYIKNNNNFGKVEVVDDNSSIEFINEHYKKINKSDIDKYQFNINEVSNENKKLKYSSIFNPITMFINGFKKVFDYSTVKKILLIGFFLSGIFIMYATGSIAASLQKNDKDFLIENKNYLEIETKNIKLDKYIELENNTNIKYIMPGNSIIRLPIKYNDYYQTSVRSDDLSASLTSIDEITKKDILYGRMPENSKEIVVDKLSLEKMFNDTNLAQMSGITKLEKIIDMPIGFRHLEGYKIVGITNLEEPLVFIDKNEFMNIINYNTEEAIDTFDYDFYNGKFTLKEGRLPVNDYEVIVNINNKETMKLNKEIDKKINDKKLVVVGYYFSEYGDDFYLVNRNTKKYETLKEMENITIYPINKETIIKENQDQNYNIVDTYKRDKDRYIKNKNKSIKATLISSGITLLISLIEILFMIRSSFLSRIKEVGIYRAIGVKKIDIYKMFFGEIFAITTLASLPGMICMAYIEKILTEISYFKSMFLISPFVLFITLILIYLFNIIVGLMPVYKTIKKTPAQILSRYDVD